jgi:hypothetical protein
LPVRILARVGVPEDRSLQGESVDVRGLVEPASVAGQVPPAKVVHEEEENIWTTGSFGHDSSVEGGRRKTIKIFMYFTFNYINFVTLHRQAPKPLVLFPQTGAAVFHRGRGALSGAERISKRNLHGNGEFNGIDACLKQQTP